MAQQGSSASLGSTCGIENCFRGKEFTVPACTLNFVQMIVGETNANGDHDARAAVYDTSGNLVLQSAIIGDMTTTPTARDFTFTSGTLSAGTYRFGLISNRSTGDLEITNGFGTPDYENESLSPAVEDAPDGPTPPATTTLVTGFRDYAVLIDYTEGGGSSVSRRMTLLGV